MLLRRYGSTIQSVEPDFDANALTEIGFTRTGDFREEAEAFLERHERVAVHELEDRTEGDVKTEVESELLRRLLEKLAALRQEAGEGAVLLVENQRGEDHPKLQDKTTGRIVQGENRFYFEYTVDPPLRVGVYRPRG